MHAVRTTPARIAARLPIRVTPKYRVGSRQTDSANRQKQSQARKEVAVKGGALKPYLGKWHNVSHEFDAAGPGFLPAEELSTNLEGPAGSGVLATTFPILLLLVTELLR